jgi:hypothetical protein
MRSFTRVVLIASMFGAAVGFVACGSAQSDKGDLIPGDDPDSSTSVDGGTTTDDSGISVGCKPACTGTQYCSVTNVCIEKGTCAGDGDCAAGMKCDATKKCIPGGDCGSQKAGAMAIPPNFLITLDRSCSMTGKVGTLTKWQIAVDSLTKMMTKYTGKIRFGLTMFPDTVKPDCAQGTIPFEPAVGNEPKISMLLKNALVATDPNFPDGPCVTNLDTGVEQASKSPTLTDKTRSNFVVLVSDGAQAGCNLAGGDAGSEKIIADMLTRGIKTAVIGFGAGVDGAQLDKFAVAGGIPAAGATKYYKAEDATSLDAVLATIAGAALGCTYTLDKVPPDPNKIVVFFDGSKEIPKDGTNGWTYDPTTNTITFHGTSCSALKGEMVKTLDIVLGCKGPA